MARLTADQINENRERILSSATHVFSRSGYNGVTLRDIAKKTRLPLGSHYNYYDDKLDLFKATVERASTHFLSPENGVIRYFIDSKFPDDLPKLADAIRDSIETHEPYFKLMYVDVVEFDGKHIRESFSNLDAKFKAALGDKIKTLGGLGRGKKIEPSFALVAIYIWLYQYFLMTKLFGATKVFGAKTDAQVVGGLIDIFKHGIEPR